MSDTNKHAAGVDFAACLYRNVIELHFRKLRCARYSLSYVALFRLNGKLVNT